MTHPVKASSGEEPNGGIRARPLTRHIGVEVAGLDLTRPLADEQVAVIQELLFRHTVLIFRDQELTPTDHVRFTRYFGEPEIHPLGQFNLPTHPEVVIISNVFRDGKPIGIYDDNEMEWHVDHAPTPRPSGGSFLFAVKAAEVGGDTLFAAADAAFDALPAKTKERVQGLRARHSTRHLVEERQKTFKSDNGLKAERARVTMPDVIHPLVRTHPVTGRKSLLIGSLSIAEIVGLAELEGTALVQQLLEHMTQDKFVYRHEWRTHDLVCWDNRTAVHTATPCDRRRYTRVLHRTSVGGDPVT